MKSYPSQLKLRFEGLLYNYRRFEDFIYQLYNFPIIKYNNLPIYKCSTSDMSCYIGYINGILDPVVKSTCSLTRNVEVIGTVKTK